MQLKQSEGRQAVCTTAVQGKLAPCTERIPCAGRADPVCRVNCPAHRADRHNKEKNMLNYEEELKKFHPSMDVNEAEDAIYSRDLTDVTDILKEMMRDEKERKNKNRK